MSETCRHTVMLATVLAGWQSRSVKQAVLSDLMHLCMRGQQVMLPEQSADEEHLQHVPLPSTVEFDSTAASTMVSSEELVKKS